MTGPTGVDVDALADAVEKARTRANRARQAREDALHAFDEAVQESHRADLDFHNAVAAYNAHKGWRS